MERSSRALRRCGGGRHLTFGMAAPFAGGRRNVGLGRSGTFVEVSSSAGGRTGDSGCPLDSRGGERRQRAPPKHTHPTRIGLRARDPRQIGDASFARSRDPCSSFVTSVTRRGSHRGRANPRKREQPATGTVTSDWARLAARHRPARAPRDAYRKGRRSRPPSLRGNESSGRSARTSTQLQKSVGGVGSRISSCAALQKEWRRE